MTKPSADDTPCYLPLPETGISREAIEEAFNEIRANDKDARASFGERWLNDRGLLLEDGALEVAKAAHMTFFTKNNSHTMIMNLECELVSWVLNLYHAQPGASGTLTSGGSESLFLATAAAFEKFQTAHGPDAPCEAVIPETGYPTFEKYSKYLGYSVRRLPVDAFMRANPKAMQAALTDKTFMMLGTLSSWAHGACDPISELAAVAKTFGVWLHVDACVGGMLAPFAQDLGRDVVDFDFLLPGVSSISVDFHKYGYSSKGVSGVFFRHHDLSDSLPFSFDDWSAGLYRSPVFTGTRSGGAIASAWAVARYLGREGYQRRTAQVLKARDAIVETVQTNPNLVLIGGADLATVAIGSDTIDILSVAQCLTSFGWTVNRLKDPDGIQLVLGPIKDAYIDAYVEDLGRAVGTVKAERKTRQPVSVVYSDEVVRGPGSISGQAE